MTRGVNPVIRNSELSLKPVAGGTLCTLLSPALRACETTRGKSKAYFRLRIMMPPSGSENPFVELVPVYDRNFVSGYDQIDYLDFRLNEARTLPTDIENRMAREQPADTVSIKLVAFLTAVPVSAELFAARGGRVTFSNLTYRARATG